MSAPFATRWVDTAGTRRNHVCCTCDFEWPVEDRYRWWPIRASIVNPWHHRYRKQGWRGVLRYGLHDLRFTWYWKPGQWGSEIGSDRLWRRWFSRHWGWLLFRVTFGPAKWQPTTERLCPACGACFWRKEG